MAQRARPLVRTVDELDLLPDDGNRYELIDGVLFVSAAPRHRHQRMVVELVLRLAPYARAVGLEIVLGPHGVRASAITQVEPDLVCLSRASGEQLELNWSSMRTAHLIVEVLSPSNTSLDRGRKRELYLREGVSEYWIVDPQRCAIEVWRPGVDSSVTFRPRELLKWQPVPAAPPLTIDLQSLADSVQ